MELLWQGFKNHHLQKVSCIHVITYNMTSNWPQLQTKASDFILAWLQIVSVGGSMRGLHDPDERSEKIKLTR